MNSLESRKRLLIAESDLNRAQLGLDWCVITAHGRTFTDRSKSLAALASSAAALVAAFAAWRRGKSTGAAATSSWLQTLLKGAGLISTLWLALGPPGRNHNDKS
jgi:hypothetical protein